MSSSQSIGLTDHVSFPSIYDDPHDPENRKGIERLKYWPNLVKRVVGAIFMGSMTTIGLGVVLSATSVSLTVWHPSLLNANWYITSTTAVDSAIPLIGGGVIGLSLLISRIKQSSAPRSLIPPVKEGPIYSGL